jgi:hypothetical protein
MVDSKRKTPQAREPLLVRGEEVARALSVSPRQLEYWRTEGRIPCHKFGRRCVRYSLPAVLEALGVERGGA